VPTIVTEKQEDGFCKYNINVICPGQAKDNWKWTKMAKMKEERSNFISSSQTRTSAVTLMSVK
jgi:hypothetical protein